MDITKGLERYLGGGSEDSSKTGGVDPKVAALLAGATGKGVGSRRASGK